jgi:tRNA(Ile)-lysidine synthase
LNTYAFEVPGEVILKEGNAVIKAFLENDVDGYGVGKTMAVFDGDKTGTVLTVRPRKNGDFFYPVGFGRRKKLQDYFVDEKVPRDERDRIPLIISGEDIVWIVGYRGDERFKVTEETKKILRLEARKIKE